MNKQILREDANRLMRLSAVDVLLADKTVISDGLESELYAFREKLEQEESRAQERHAGYLKDMAESLQVLPGSPGGAATAAGPDVMF